MPSYIKKYHLSIRQVRLLYPYIYRDRSGRLLKSTYYFFLGIPGWKDSYHRTLQTGDGNVKWKIIQFVIVDEIALNLE